MFVRCVFFSFCIEKTLSTRAPFFCTRTKTTCVVFFFLSFIQSISSLLLHAQFCEWWFYINLHFFFLPPFFPADEMQHCKQLFINWCRDCTKRSCIGAVDSTRSIRTMQSWRRPNNGATIRSIWYSVQRRKSRCHWSIRIMSKFIWIYWRKLYNAVAALRFPNSAWVVNNKFFFVRASFHDTLIYSDINWESFSVCVVATTIYGV